jgi:hypothetical protein
LTQLRIVFSIHAICVEAMGYRSYGTLATDTDMRFSCGVLATDNAGMNLVDEIPKFLRFKAG